MKHLLTISFFIIAAQFCWSQQEETYTQYIFNQYAVNPAYGGTTSCADVKLGTRLQWVGFDGAPVTSFFSYHTSIGFKDRTSKSWHGMGVYLVDDRTGYYKSTALYPSYAFHKRLTHRVVASAGFFIGIRNLATGKAVGSADPLLAPTVRIIFPDLGAGILVYNPEWYLGISMKQAYTNTLSVTGQSGALDNPYQYRARQYYLTAARWVEAYAFSFSYTPSMQVKFHESVLPSVDLSIMFHYIENKFNMGASYRVGDGIAAMLQFNLLKKLSVAYAYEYPLSKINNGTRQTHEIMLKWDPCWSTNDHFGGVNCPAF